MELTDNDKQRIEQANRNEFMPYKAGWIAGAEYATIYEREQQLSEFGLEYYKKEANRMGEMYLERNSECVHLKAERSEVRNKVIEECVEKVRYSYNLSLGATDTVVELLNSLKTK